MTHKIPYLWDCGEGCCYQFIILEQENNLIVSTFWKGTSMTNIKGNKHEALKYIIEEFLDFCRNNNIDASHIVTSEGELVENSI